MSYLCCEIHKNETGMYSADNADEEYYLRPEFYAQTFHNNVCHVCKRSENLMRCSRCSSVVYCSKFHQKLDWKYHKDFCKALAKAKDLTKNEMINDFIDLFDIRKWRVNLMEKELGRKLKSMEICMVAYARFCQFCCNENVSLECPECNNAYFCSEDHLEIFKEDHAKFCTALKLSKEVNSTWILSEIDCVIERTFIVSDIPNDYQNLPSTLGKLLDLYDKNSKNVDDDVKPYLTKLYWLSPAASILYALERIRSLTERQFHKKRLIIHIVTVQHYETNFNWKEMLELFFHWIKNLTKLQYFIIGPTVASLGFRNMYTKELCDNCQKKKVRTTCSFHTKTYREAYFDLKKPDLVVCFNSGIANKENNYEESIGYLLTANVPLILTAHSLYELNDDIARIKEITTFSLVLKPQPNPFHDGKPYRHLDPEMPVYYNNGFIAVLQRL